MISATAATATPTDFIDLGTIGEAGEFVFDTVGSMHVDGSSAGLTVDTELGIWTEGGTLLDADDDDGPGLFSEITIDLTDGIYFLGISEFSTIFADDFINTGTGFETDEVADLVLNINGALGGLFEDASDQLDQETAFFRVTVGEISAVPLPAGMPLLLAGLGAFAFARRRKANT